MANINDAITRIAGGLFCDVTEVTAANTVTTSMFLISADSTAGAFTSTLPPLASAYDAATGTGQILVVYLETDGGDHTIDGNASETIGGSATLVQGDAGDVAILQATSDDWAILKQANLGAADLADGAVTPIKLEGETVVDDDAAHTVVATDRLILVTETDTTQGTVTFGDTAVQGHIVTVRCVAATTGSYITSGIDSGEVTLDAADESATFIYDETNDNWSQIAGKGHAGLVTQAEIAANALDGTVAADVADDNVIGGIPVIHRIDITAGANADVDVTLTHKTRVLDAWVLMRGAGVGSAVFTVKSTGNAITDAMDVSGSDTAIVRAATIDDDNHEIAASGVLRVTGSGGATMPEATVYVLGVRVA